MPPVGVCTYTVARWYLYYLDDGLWGALRGKTDRTALTLPHWLAGGGGGGVSPSFTRVFPLLAGSRHLSAANGERSSSSSCLAPLPWSAP